MTLAIGVSAADGSGSILVTDSMATRRGWGGVDVLPAADKFDWLTDTVPFVYSGLIAPGVALRHVRRARGLCGTDASWRELALELWTGARCGGDGLGGPRKPEPCHLVVTGPDGVGLFASPGDVSEWPALGGIVVGGAVRDWWLGSLWSSSPPIPRTLMDAFAVGISMGSLAVRENWKGWGRSRLEDFLADGLVPPVAGPLHTLIVTSAGTQPGPEVQL